MMSVWSHSQGPESILGEGPEGAVAVGVGAEGEGGRLVGEGGVQKLWEGFFKHSICAFNCTHDYNQITVCQNCTRACQVSVAM